jgi:hypothetical protein
MYGFGFPGQGYYCLKVPGASKAQQPRGNVGKITVKKGEANEKIEKELKHLIDGSWQWRVRKLNDCEYLATFPNKKILETFSRSNGLELAIYNISIMISTSDMDPEVSALLQTGWVRLTNVPNPARNVEGITAIAELAGEVISVDEVTLIRDEPIRVKIRAREIAKINGSVEYFVEGVGFFIKFTPEARAQRGPSDKQLPHHKKRDDDDLDDEEEDTLFDSDDDPIKKMRGGDEDGGPPSQNSRGGQNYKGKIKLG